MCPYCRNDSFENEAEQSGEHTWINTCKKCGKKSKYDDRTDKQSKIVDKPKKTKTK